MNSPVPCLTAPLDGEQLQRYGASPVDLVQKNSLSKKFTLYLKKGA